jgi:hypothetical protein
MVTVLLDRSAYPMPAARVAAMAVTKRLFNINPSVLDLKSAIGV